MNFDFDELERIDFAMLIYVTIFIVFIISIVSATFVYVHKPTEIQASSVSQISEKYAVEKIGKISKSYKGVAAIAIDDMNDDSKKDIVTMDQYGNIFILYRR